jgi:alpha-ketoglutarate-dependent 2,4-dichlorophenoxyacetate dioxygenase
MRATKRRLHQLFGYELVGFDIKRGLSPEEIRFASDAIAEGGVLLLRTQDANEDDLVRFAQNFGTLSYMPMIREGSHHIIRLSNMDKDGNILPQTHRLQQSHIANQLWHTDTSYLRPRATLSLLLSYITPPMGANTELCDMRIAYEGLSAAERKRLEGLTAHHSILHSRKRTGFNDWSDKERVLLKGVARPLAHIHEPSGRKALYLASHIGAIDGMDDSDAQALVEELTAIATIPERVHVHEWQPGDLLIWDNLCTMHRATPFDHQRYPRDIRSVRLNDPTDVCAGEAAEPTAEAAY